MAVTTLSLSLCLTKLWGATGDSYIEFLFRAVENFGDTKVHIATVALLKKWAVFKGGIAEIMVSKASA